MSARRVKVPPFKACRKCKSLVPREATRCPVCGSTDISEDWEGTLVVINPEMSLIAKRLEINRPGRYAIKVR
ncbi:DNA-directed RNA polymerase subunit E'' [Pyrodictium delaneyi]|uniref:Transcription elongation factor Spt4 n=1 Tax=Pyrodictium delaneyi TaxID=1273541 RepID=A0A0P0N229_9CREN|nr:transcription elongation factor subunit Spt4 [Pyrodictium delaneyi]ALL00170.1 DNA-directed RNA polymerase subunit E'' [Pyrodictium delaneyi]